jgi:Protein of unknown function (DUF805)
MITFQGRIGRSRFALHAALCWVAIQVTTLLGAVSTYALLAPSMGERVPQELAAVLSRELSGVLYVLMLLTLLLLLFIALSLSVRRFHDFLDGDIELFSDRDAGRRRAVLAWRPGELEWYDFVRLRQDTTKADAAALDKWAARIVEAPRSQSDRNSNRAPSDEGIILRNTPTRGK